MYKIFINEKPFLITATDTDDARFVACKRVDYTPQKLLALIRETETLRSKGIVLLCEDEDLAVKDFFTHFVHIEAAGGVVYNSSNELLLIKRIGKWDLPKGKIDGAETPNEAAIREVMEECGIDRPELGEKLPSTYHTYKMHNHRFLKTTHWFRMQASYKKELIPQLEEQITEAKWFETDKLDINQLDTYASIRHLLQQVL